MTTNSSVRRSGVRVHAAATADDFDRARGLIDEYYAWALAAGGYDDLAAVAPATAAELDHLADHYTNRPSARLLLAGRDGEAPVGVCAIERLDDRSAELKRLYVQPAARGRGVASQLISAAVELARGMGCEVLRLDTHTGIMLDAISLYRRVGFVESGHRCTDIEVDGMVGFELRLPSRKPNRARTALALVWMVLAAIMLTAIPSARAAAASDPPPPAFPPGIWKGVAVITGGISGADMDGFVTAPAPFTFEVEVAPDGTVVDGTWTATAQAAAVGADGQGSATMSGSGTLSGTSARIALTGSMHVTGTVVVAGATIPVDVDVPVQDFGFSPTSATCAVVTGDLATEGREDQAAAGFATTVVGPFTAHRIGNTGENLAPDFEHEYLALVNKMEDLLVTDNPPATEVVALAERIERFYVNVFTYASSGCSAGSEVLASGKIPHTHFVEQFGKLLLKVLDDPTAYLPSELYELGLAAERVGVFGSAAPNPELAQQVKQALFDALSAHLSGALAAGDKLDCVVIRIAASSFGFDELVPDAQACVAGARSFAPGYAAQPGEPLELGLADVMLAGPEPTGGGDRPTFAWQPVDGAARYVLAVVGVDGEPLWAWSGTTTGVILGGWPEAPIAEAPGPLLTAPSEWFVVAFDGTGAPIANSPLRRLAP